MTDHDDDSTSKGKALYLFRPKRSPQQAPPDEPNASGSRLVGIESSDENAAERTKASCTFKSLTLRLNLDAWRQLRHLAIEQDATGHELLVEAVNDFFRKHRKPPLA